jgi:dTDP-4-dehydrorhamnose 3,5-epimerase-like enzyme
MTLIPLEINFEDDRGIIMDLLSKQDMNAATLISFKKGAIRGNHYHKHTIQYNFILKGSLKYAYQTGDGPIGEVILSTDNSSRLNFSEAWEKHAMIALEDTEMLVFTMGPRGGNDYETDTYRLEIPLI